MPPIQQEGRFRGRVIQTDVVKSKNGAVGVFVRFAVDEVRVEDGWGDWREHQIEAEGYFYVINTDGRANEINTGQLVSALGWDGHLQSAATDKYRQVPCQFEVKHEVYQEKDRYKVASIYPHDSEGGLRGALSAEDAKVLDAKYGSQLRAVVGNTARNAPVATPAPAQPVAAGPADKDIPF